MKRVVNFRLGRGMLRERKKLMSPDNLIKTFKALGLTDEEILQKFRELLGVPIPSEKKELKP